MAISVLAIGAVACGDDDSDEVANGGGNVDSEDETRVEPVEDEVYGFIDGTENGAVKFPVLELWDIPDCTCDKLIANTPHGTRVKVLNKKPNCNGVPYEVELLDGEQKGAKGWVLERFLHFGDDPPPSDVPFDPNNQ